DAAVLGVGDGDLAVPEQVGVIGFVEVAGGRPGLVLVPDLPQNLSGREGDDLDRLVLFLVGDDRVAVVYEERVVRERETEPAVARWRGGGPAGLVFPGVAASAACCVGGRGPAPSRGSGERRLPPLRRSRRPGSA